MDATSNAVKAGSDPTARAGAGPGALTVRELLDANALARGLAIWTVVACHVPFAHAFWRPLWVVASAGKLAVSLFLFLSGLMLQVQVNRAGGAFRLWPWLKKRFLRIYPVYWAGLALTALCAWRFQGLRYDAWTLAANVLGIPVWLHRKVVSGGYAAPFWFISLLLLCYALFPLVCRVRRKFALALAALALSGVAFWRGNVLGAAAFAFPAFFMGLAMADVVRRNGETVPAARFHAWTFPVLLVFLALVFKGQRFLPVEWRSSPWLDVAGCAGLTLAAWPALCATAFLQRGLARRAPALLRGALWVSGLSFATYCVHEPLLAVLAKASGAGHPWSGMAGYVGIVLAASWLLDAMDRRIRGAP